MNLSTLGVWGLELNFSAFGNVILVFSVVMEEIITILGMLPGSKVYFGARFNIARLCSNI